MKEFEKQVNYAIVVAMCSIAAGSILSIIINWIRGN